MGAGVDIVVGHVQVRCYQVRCYKASCRLANDSVRKIDDQGDRGRSLDDQRRRRCPRRVAECAAGDDPACPGQDSAGGGLTGKMKCRRRDECGWRIGLAGRRLRPGKRIAAAVFLGLGRGDDLPGAAMAVRIGEDRARCQVEPDRRVRRQAGIGDGGENEQDERRIAPWRAMTQKASCVTPSKSVQPTSHGDGWDLVIPPPGLCPPFTVVAMRRSKVHGDNAPRTRRGHGTARAIVLLGWRQAVRCQT